MCSRTVSDTANMSRHGSTLCSPTVEKLLCRSPISQRSHVGNLRQTIQGKGVIHKRVETVGVYPLVRPRGVSALPAEVQRKPPRPLGANTLTQFAHPGQPVQRNRLPPRKGEPADAVRVPRSAGAEKGCRPERMNRAGGSSPPVFRCRNFYHFPQQCRAPCDSS